MTSLLHALPDDLVWKIGWTLLHLLWEGVAIALIVAVLLLWLRRAAAGVRYMIAVGGLALIPIAGAVTFTQLHGPAPAQRPRIEAVPFVQRMMTGPAPAVPPPLTSANPLPSTATTELSEPLPVRVTPPRLAPQAAIAWKTRALTFINVHLALFVWAWIAGVTLFSIRLLGGWVHVQRLRSRHTLPANTATLEMLRTLTSRLNLRRPVRLVQTCAARTPMVIGWLRPIVLLPVTAATGLTEDQLYAVLAHELAHIRRHDYLVNLAQSVIETVLFYHPAVWWLSRRVRIEREHCCDDLAIACCGDRLLYARALASLESLRATPLLAAAATSGSLLARIRRIVTPSSPPISARSWQPALIALLLLAAIGAGARLRAQTAVPPVPRKPAATAPAAPESIDGVRLRISVPPGEIPFGDAIQLTAEVANTGSKLASWYQPEHADLKLVRNWRLIDARGQMWMPWWTTYQSMEPRPGIIGKVHEIPPGGAAPLMQAKAAFFQPARAEPAADVVRIGGAPDDLATATPQCLPPGEYRVNFWYAKGDDRVPTTDGFTQIKGLWTGRIISSPQTIRIAAPTKPFLRVQRLSSNQPQSVPPLELVVENPTDRPLSLTGLFDLSMYSMGSPRHHVRFQTEPTLSATSQSFAIEIPAHQTYRRPLNLAEIPIERMAPNTAQGQSQVVEKLVRFSELRGELFSVLKFVDDRGKESLAAPPFQMSPPAPARQTTTAASDARATQEEDRIARLRMLRELNRRGVSSQEVSRALVELQAADVLENRTRSFNFPFSQPARGLAPEPLRPMPPPVGTWHFSNPEGDDEQMAIFPDGRVTVFYSNGHTDRSRLTNGRLTLSEYGGLETQLTLLPDDTLLQRSEPAQGLGKIWIRLERGAVAKQLIHLTGPDKGKKLSEVTPASAPAPVEQSTTAPAVAPRKPTPLDAIPGDPAAPASQPQAVRSSTLDHPAHEPPSDPVTPKIRIEADFLTPSSTEDREWLRRLRLQEPRLTGTSIELTPEQVQLLRNVPMPTRRVLPELVCFSGRQAQIVIGTHIDVPLAQLEKVERGQTIIPTPLLSLVKDADPGVGTGSALFITPARMDGGLIGMQIDAASASFEPGRRRLYLARQAVLHISRPGRSCLVRIPFQEYKVVGLTQSTAAHTVRPNESRLVGVPRAPGWGGVSHLYVIVTPTIVNSAAETASRPADSANAARDFGTHRPSSKPAGVYYMMEGVARPGVYSMLSSTLTLRRAIAAAGGVEKQIDLSKAWCQITRHHGRISHRLVPMDLEPILSGKVDDVPLRSEDVIEIHDTPKP